MPVLFVFDCYNILRQKKGMDMSRYEWEAGVVVIPSKDFVELKKVCKDAYNKYQNKLYEYSVRFYDRILENKPKGRKWNIHISDMRSMGFSLMEDIPEIYRWDVVRAVTATEHQLDNYKPQKPKRSWFPHIKNSKSLAISTDDFSVQLEADTRKLIWRVHENNHAVDSARENPIAKALWTHVNKIVWTRGSGGEIVGNDEYNEDPDTGAPQDNFIVASYSPVQKYVRKYPI